MDRHTEDTPKATNKVVSVSRRLFEGRSETNARKEIVIDRNHEWQEKCQYLNDQIVLQQITID